MSTQLALAYLAAAAAFVAAAAGLVVAKRLAFGEGEVANLVALALVALAIAGGLAMAAGWQP